MTIRTAIKLYELADWINGRAFNDNDFTKIGLPIVKIAELKSGIIGQTKFSNKVIDNKYLLKKGDLLFSWSGNPKTSIDTFIFSLEEGLLNQHIFKVIPNQEFVLSDYLYYLLKYLKPVFTEIATNKQTTGLGHVTIADLKRIEVSLPDKSVQGNIVKVIGSIDDKIQTNQKIISNLEKTAQLLFKHWFVDFEFPDENGKPYKSSGGEMMESELGLMPRGWSEEKLGNMANIINGFAFKSGDYQKDGVFLLRTRNFTDSGYVEKNEAVFLPVNFYDKYRNNQLHTFDVLLVMVGASVGSLGLVTSHALPALQNQNMWCFRTKKSEYQLFLKQLLEKIVKENQGSASGSARDFFRKDFFRSIKLVLPPVKIIKSFDDFARSIYEKIDVCLQENVKLVASRDILLPKLISGEVEV